MKRLKRIGVILLSICMLAALIPSETFAASAKVSVSSVSGNVGNTVTVTCTATVSGASIGAADVVLQYDPSALGSATGSSGANANAGSVVYSGSVSGDGQSSLSFTVSFKILKEGTYSVSVTNAEVWTYSGDELVPSKGSGSVTGKAVSSNSSSGGNSGTTSSGTTGSTGTTQDSKDTNNKLKSLQVSPGSLSPAFNANTTSYTVNVSEDTTELVVSAAAQSDKASVSVSGNKNIKPGENTVKVVVTAESGATKVYTLNVICGETTANQEPEDEPEKIQINGTENTIDEAFADDVIPTGFVRDKITYNGKEYEALKHEKGDLLLVSLQNDATGAVFYIFNQETQEFYNFVQISFSEGRYIIPLTLDDTKEFAGYETTTVTLQDKTFDAWKIDEEYSILRVMNSDGEIVFYQYDSLDGTLQRYAGVVEKETVEEEETELTFFSFLEKYHLYIIAGLGAVVLALIIALICVAVKKKNRHKDEYASYEEGSYAEPVHVESKRQPQEVEQQPEKKKRKHDARRRKAIKRLQKQQMKENR